MLIDKRQDEPDLLLVDTAGFGNQAAAIAMTAADAILVPTLSGEADLTEAQKTVQFAASIARVARRPIPSIVVFNRVVKHALLSKNAVKEMRDAKIPCLTATLSSLVAYGEMSLNGALPSSGTASLEVKALMAELRERGYVPAKPKTLVRIAVTA